MCAVSRLAFADHVADGAAALEAAATARARRTVWFRPAEPSPPSPVAAPGPEPGTSAASTAGQAKAEPRPPRAGDHLDRCRTVPRY
jgi:hypothetical protein